MFTTILIHLLLYIHYFILYCYTETIHLDTDHWTHIFLQGIADIDEEEDDDADAVEIPNEDFTPREAEQYNNVVSRDPSHDATRPESLSSVDNPTSPLIPNHQTPRSLDLSEEEGLSGGGPSPVRRQDTLSFPTVVTSSAARPGSHYSQSNALTESEL